MAETREQLSHIVRTGVLRLPDDRIVPVTAATSPVVLGRDARCAVVLDDPEVSSLHCEVRADAEGVLLIDLGSRNGTFVGSVRLSRGHLSAACTLRLGSSSIRFEPGERESVELSRDETFGALVGRSPSMRQIFRQLREIAPTDLAVLITGETGTGKELVAQALHNQSRRAGEPFVVVDCTSIPSALAESQLFGHEKGAFTGATSRTTGAFQQASGGTLFLDEIGDLPLELQPKLLRVLSEKKVRRVGATEYEPVNVRVIAATLQDLGRQINAGKFRPDLFFRLAQVRIELPALRDRREDIPLIIAATCGRVGHPARAAEINELIATAASQRAWRGNARELSDLVQAIAELPPGAETLRTLLPLSPESEGAVASSPYGEAKHTAVMEFERRYFTELVEKTKGNVSEMHRQSGLQRHHVRAFLRKHGLSAK